MAKNKIVQAATMKLEVELRCSECKSPLIVNNTWSDIHGLSCYVEPCEECMSRRTLRAVDGGDSAASEQLSTPEVLPTLQGESTPAHRK